MPCLNISEPKRTNILEQCACIVYNTHEMAEAKTMTNYLNDRFGKFQRWHMCMKRRNVNLKSRENIKNESMSWQLQKNQCEWEWEWEWKCIYTQSVSEIHQPTAKINIFSPWHFVWPFKLQHIEKHVRLAWFRWIRFLVKVTSPHHHNTEPT